MVRILLSGCNGKMGQVITAAARYREDVKIVAGFDISDSRDHGYPVFTQLEQCNVSMDVIIDFSHPAALRAFWIMQYPKIPLIVATTGLF